MEGGHASLSNLFTRPGAWNPSRTHRNSRTNPLLLAEQVERCRVAASSLEYTPCTEVYNAGENFNEQLENVSLPAATFNRETAADSSSGRTNTVGHVLPVVGAFAVQCARCLKWRLMPSKAKYEEIRERFLEYPFLCEDACPWRPNASCEDPADIEPNENYLWAMDKPNICVPPPGWDRQFIIRGRGASKLGDIYYISPCGKKLRSMVEVDRFLNDHPKYRLEGVHLDRFSYKTPKPLFEGYVGRKRMRSGESNADGAIRKMRGAQKIQNATQVKPFTRREHGESSCNTRFDGSGCKLTDKSDIRRPLLPLYPLFPLFPMKKKRSTRMRPTAVVSNWNI